MSAPINRVATTQETASTQKDKGKENPYRPIKRMYDALMRIHGALPEGVKRAKFTEVLVDVEFSEQERFTTPWDRLKNLKVVLTLGPQQYKLALEVAGHATDLPTNSLPQRLSLVCKISDSTMRSHRFYNPVSEEDKVKAEQTRMHQFILLREEDNRFIARISKEFLKRFLEKAQQ